MEQCAVHEAAPTSSASVCEELQWYVGRTTNSVWHAKTHGQWQWWCTARPPNGHRQGREEEAAVASYAAGADDPSTAGPENAAATATDGGPHPHVPSSPWPTTSRDDAHGARGDAPRIFPGQQPPNPHYATRTHEHVALCESCTQTIL